MIRKQHLLTQNAIKQLINANASKFRKVYENKYGFKILAMFSNINAIFPSVIIK